MEKNPLFGGTTLRVRYCTYEVLTVQRLGRQEPSEFSLCMPHQPTGVVPRATWRGGCRLQWAKRWLWWALAAGRRTHSGHLGATCAVGGFQAFHGSLSMQVRSYVPTCGVQCWPPPRKKLCACLVAIFHLLQIHRLFKALHLEPRKPGTGTVPPFSNTLLRASLNGIGVELASQGHFAVAFSCLEPL